LSSKTLEQVELSDWTKLVTKGTVNAASGLSRMLGREVKVTYFNLRKIMVSEAFDIFGGPETLVVGIYLSIQEGADGHIMLVYPPKIACSLVDMAMDNPDDTTQEIGENEESALAEIGNIVGSFFLNSMADDTGIRFQPTPPQVLQDMAGAILNIALTDIMQYADDLFIMDTTFETDDKKISGLFLVLPSGNFLDIMTKHSDEYGKVSWE